MTVWVCGPDTPLVEAVAKSLEMRLGQPVFIIVSLSQGPGDAPASWCVYRHTEIRSPFIDTWEEVMGDNKITPYHILSPRPVDVPLSWSSFEYHSVDTLGYINSVAPGTLRDINVDGQSAEEIVDMIIRDLEQYGCVEPQGETVSAA